MIPLGNGRELGGLSPRCSIETRPMDFEIFDTIFLKGGAVLFGLDCENQYRPVTRFWGGAAMARCRQIVDPVIAECSL